MKTSVIAQRYAKALFELSKQAKNESLIFTELQALEKEIFSSTEFKEFMSSPVIQSKEKESIMAKSLDNSVSDTVKTFCLLLAKNGRLSLFSEIVHAFQALADDEKGVVRGTVRAPQVLGGEEQKAIRDQVQKVIGKKPELHFEVDPALIGGLKAEVGSFTFDDSLSGHLRRMNEQLNRSAN
ncbi:MAG: ATP synthase F1 subunit delta [Bdellovibrionaceae bacterium]|nr:ATP synthase F1 subunit delta [Pseudobdellovibrionaceae bacterium]|tara:strand:- start:5426 stop:5971 length:546 start_codon:yes stop_codon:yes gene_type:complete